MSLADELEKLNRLLQSGAISDEEYQEAKKSLIQKQEVSGPPQPAGQPVVNASLNVNQWCMFIHLSQLLGFIFLVAGLVVPIILWQIKKNESPLIDRHGRIVTNWIITELILGFVFFLLSFIIIGIPLLIALSIAGIAFSIIGGIRANNGEVWVYPFSFKFFPTD
ncbi:DUF4870 domain-containing protein [Candidatus Sumerlaeota bacterium]|nr:DUF4870 domain-containing protein [Candidatus Sumerlaeota bacterium]